MAAAGVGMGLGLGGWWRSDRVAGWGAQVGQSDQETDRRSRARDDGVPGGECWMLLDAVVPARWWWEDRRRPRRLVM